MRSNFYLTVLWSLGFPFFFFHSGFGQSASVQDSACRSAAPIGGCDVCADSSWNKDLPFSYIPEFGEPCTMKVGIETDSIPLTFEIKNCDAGEFCQVQVTKLVLEFDRQMGNSLIGFDGLNECGLSFNGNYVNAVLPNVSASDIAPFQITFHCMRPGGDLGDFPVLESVTTGGLCIVANVAIALDNPTELIVQGASPNRTAGPWTTGPQLGLGLSFPLGKHFRWEVAASAFQQNPAYFPEKSLPTTIQSRVDTELTATTGNSFLLNTGPVIRLGRNRFFLDLYGRAGLVQSFMPELPVQLPDPNGEVITLSEYDTQARGFTYTAGAKAQLRIGRRLKIFAGLSLTNSFRPYLLRRQRDLSQAIDKATNDVDFDALRALPLVEEAVGLKNRAIDVGLSIGLGKR